MNILKQASIKNKLMIISLATTFIALAAASFILLIWELVSSQRSLVHELTAISSTVGANSTASITFKDRKSAEETLEALNVVPNIISGTINLKDGTRFASYSREKGKEGPSCNYPQGKGYEFTPNRYTVYQPISLDKEVIGTICIHSDLQRFYARIGAYGIGLVIAIAASLFIAFVMLSKLQKEVTEPILDLVELTRVVSTKEDYSVRAVSASKDEIGSLVQGFNDMLTQIQWRDTELEMHRKHLLELVSKRTTQLGQVNEQLIKELAERNKAEEQVRSSLREKEVLLKEIHHRVKNNLQVISSLLSLQATQTKDRETHDMFLESQNRVKSIALIHEKLYQSKDLAKIDFAEYAKNLVNHLFRSYGVSPDLNAPEIRILDTYLTVETAIPYGLILNELVSNCFKHAFPKGRKGRIFIDFHREKDHAYMLTVADNGIGFPDHVDYKHTDSFGLQLVQTLVAQLSGTIELKKGGGTKFIITSPIPMEHENQEV